MTSPSAAERRPVDEPEPEPQEEPGVREVFEGKLLPVVNPRRTGWWRFHEHYDRNGYCDNPARGY